MQTVLAAWSYCIWHWQVATTHTELAQNNSNNNTNNNNHIVPSKLRYPLMTAFSLLFNSMIGLFITVRFHSSCSHTGFCTQDPRADTTLNLLYSDLKNSCNLFKFMCNQNVTRVQLTSLLIVLCNYYVVHYLIIRHLTNMESFNVFKNVINGRALDKFLSHWLSIGVIMNYVS